MLVLRTFKFLSDSEQWIRNMQGTQGTLEADLPRSGDWEQGRRAAHLQDRKDFCCCLAAKSCPTLATPWTNPAGFSVHGIFQASMLEWVAISVPRNDFIHSLKAGLLVRVTIPVSCSGVLLEETQCSSVNTKWRSMWHSLLSTCSPGIRFIDFETSLNIKV